MTQKPRVGRHRRGTASRPTRRQITKDKSPAHPSSCRQPQKQVLLDEHSSAKLRSPRTEKTEAPQESLLDQNGGVVAGTIKDEATTGPTARANRKRERASLENAHRPCTRSQTRRAAGSVSAETFCAEVTVADDTYGKYYPQRNTPGLDASPSRLSNEDPPVKRPKLEKPAVRTKRGIGEQTSVDEATAEEPHHGQLSKKARVSRISRQACSSSAFRSAGESTTSWPEAICEHLAEVNGAPNLSQSEYQQKKADSSKPSSSSHRTQQRRQTKTRATKRQRSNARLPEGEAHPSDAAGWQDQGACAQCVLDPTRTRSSSGESLSLAAGRFNADEQLFSDAPPESCGAPSSFWPSRQQPQEPPEDLPYYYYMSDYPAPRVAARRFNADERRFSDAPSERCGASSNLFWLSRRQSHELPQELPYYYHMRDYPGPPVAASRFSRDEQLPSDDPPESCGAPSSLCWSSRQEPQEPPEEDPYYSRLRDLIQPCEPPEDQRVASQENAHNGITDETEAKSPTSTERWRQKVMSALNVCIPESVLREAAAAPPVLDLPEGLDNSVLSDRSLELSSRTLPSATSCANSDATTSGAPDNILPKIPLSSMEQDDVSGNGPSQSRLDTATGSPAAARSRTISPGSDGPYGRPAQNRNDRYAQASSSSTASNHRVLSETAPPSQSLETTLTLCLELLQKYKSHVLSRPDGDRWRHLFSTDEPNTRRQAGEPAR